MSGPQCLACIKPRCLSNIVSRVCFNKRLCRNKIVYFILGNNQIGGWQFLNAVLIGVNRSRCFTNDKISMKMGLWIKPWHLPISWPILFLSSPCPLPCSNRKLQHTHPLKNLLTTYWHLVHIVYLLRLRYKRKFHIRVLLIFFKSRMRIGHSKSTIVVTLAINNNKNYKTRYSVFYLFRWLHFF